MAFLIDEDKLKLLLEKRRDFISGCKAGGLVAFGSSVVFAGFTSDFPDVSDRMGTFIRYGMIIVGVVLICLGLYVMVKNHKVFYNQNDLHAEIMELDMTSHRFSVVIIKDTFNEYPNRYLVRYVKDWDCRLFFSFPTVELDDEGNLVSQLSNALHVPKDSISLKFRTEDYVTKYSVKDKVTKTYDHRYYVAEISNYRPELQEDQFRIGDVDYYWMSYEKMNQDKRIHEFNKDIIDYVKDHIA